MSSLEEWQAKVDSDFPNGAMISRSDMKDVNGDPETFLTAAVTVQAISDSGFPVLQVWLDDEFEKDGVFTAIEYSQTRDQPRQVRVKTTGPVSWTLTDLLPKSLVGTEEWKALREAQRLISTGQELPPELAKKVDF